MVKCYFCEVDGANNDDGYGQVFCDKCWSAVKIVMGIYNGSRK